jgi:SAM-dependent methyltransferase
MTERDYVLGTHDAEIERLGLQHRVWRAHALRVWRRAGIATGSKVLDLGAGPGYASLDLAEIVGPTGSVTAIERSARFVEHARAAARARGLAQLAAREADLVETDLGDAVADASWCRWVLSFANDPRTILAKLRRALRPGGVAVFHEYVDYAAWKLSPHSPAHEHFVTKVMHSWRDAGGEPDIARSLPGLLVAAGFDVASLVPRQEIARPGDWFWDWPKSYVETGPDRLVELGYMSSDEAAAVKQAVRAAETQPGAFFATPIVLEIIAQAR